MQGQPKQLGETLSQNDTIYYNQYNTVQYTIQYNTTQYNARQGKAREMSTIQPVQYNTVNTALTSFPYSLLSILYQTEAMAGPFSVSMDYGYATHMASATQVAA